MADFAPITDMALFEEWRDIPDWEGSYQASTLGRIRGVERRGRLNRRLPLRILRTCPDSWGYPHLGLSSGRYRVTRKAHKLVALTFLGKPDGRQVNHINGDKADNRLTNLEYVSASENIRHSIDVLGNVHGGSIKCAVVGAPVCGGEAIHFESSHAAARAGFCGSHVIKCCKGKLNHHGGYVWSYDNS